MSLVGVDKVIKSQTINGSSGYSNGTTMDIRNTSEYGAILVIESGTTTEVKLISQVIASRENDRDLVGVGKEAGLSWVTVETVIARLSSGSTAKTFYFPPFKWGRVRVEGLGKNGTDTVVSVYVGARG